MQKASLSLDLKFNLSYQGSAPDYFEDARLEASLDSVNWQLSCKYGYLKIHSYLDFLFSKKMFWLLKIIKKSKWLDQKERLRLRPRSS